MTYDPAFHHAERQWLDGAVAYEVFDDPLMEDHAWDALGVYLWQNRERLSAPFCHLVFGCWPAPAGEPGENPLKTASGIKWEGSHLGRLLISQHPREFHHKLS